MTLNNASEFISNVCQTLDAITESQGDILQGVITTLSESPAARQTERIVLEFLQGHQVATARKNCLTYMENYTDGWFAMVSVVDKAFVIQIGLFDKPLPLEPLTGPFTRTSKAPSFTSLLRTGGPSLRDIPNIPMGLEPLTPDTEF